MVWIWIYTEKADEHRRQTRQVELSARPKVVNNAFCAKTLAVFDQLDLILKSGNLKLIADLYESKDLRPVDANRSLDYQSSFGKWVKVSSYDGSLELWLDECWIDGRVLDKKFGKLNEAETTSSGSQPPRGAILKLGLTPQILREGTEAQILAEARKASSDFAMLDDAEQLRIITYLRLGIADSTR